MKAVVSDYAVCKKCGVKYSTLTRHKCFKRTVRKATQVDEGKIKEHDLEAGPPTESLEEHECPTPSEDTEDAKGKKHKGKAEGDGDGEGEKSDGDGDEEGEGEDDGSGQSDEGDGDEGEQRQSEGEGEGEGEEEGDGEGEGPTPQSPDPETPPVAVVCTVLKFAALTAQCAKNGAIGITLEEDGLLVYGQNGDRFSTAIIPWGEFEKRSTIDGEFYVKEIIDGVDEQIGQTAKVDVSAMIEKYKPEEPVVPEAPDAPEPPKLTLPMFAGQRVVCRDGKAREVARVDDSSDIAHFSDGSSVFTNSGTCGTDPKNSDYPWDAIADAKLTLPMFKGQRVICRDGSIRTVSRKGRDDTADFAEGGCVWADHQKGHEDGSGGVGGWGGVIGTSRPYDAFADAPAEEKPILTLPLTVGQKVKLRDGRTARVAEVNSDPDYVRLSIYRKPLKNVGWVYASTGKWNGSDRQLDAVADA